MTTKKVLTAAEVVKIADEARQDWADKYISEEQIRNTIHQRLDAIMNKTIMAFLGIQESYGRIEIDRVNGRRPVLFSQIERIAEQTVPELAKKYLSKVQERLTKDEINAIREEYKRCLKSYLRNMVAEKAQADAQELLAHITKNEDWMAQKLEDNRIGLEELASDECGSP
jgi:predicted ArsR family transcriptional regulator